MPQCFGLTPWMTTWMCSFAAPLDSCSASVSFSIIFGTDSSVTRCSYSLTSIHGIASPFLSAFDVLRAAVRPEHEVTLPVRHMIQRNRRERLDELTAVLRPQRMLDSAVDHRPVADA